jgi:catechol 2,3-dioxygenase-like lactoylglutathione lyase family enzyme
MTGATARAIMAVLRTVPDLQAAETFYRDALGFTTLEPSLTLGSDEADLMGVPGVRVSSLTMELGKQQIGLLAFDPPAAPYPADSTASDLWFQHCALVVADMEAAYRQVSRFAITPLSAGGPQQLPPNTGGVRAFKFRDPFGHPLELLWFPPGAGDPVWQARNGALFRGIDHTAIAVREADASAGFYRGALGLVATDRSRNRGPAQEHLDALPGDVVDIVALAPRQAPPHLELLGYRTGTRRRAAGTSPADASVSRTLAVVDDLAAQTCVAADGLHQGRWRGRTAATFRDPDGHSWICMEP